MKRIWLLPLNLGQMSILTPLTDPPTWSTSTSPTIHHPLSPPCGPPHTDLHDETTATIGSRRSDPKGVSDK